MTVTVTPTIHEFTSTTAPGRVFYVCGTCWYASHECQDRKPCPFCTCHICHEQPRAKSGWPCAECKARLDAERDLKERAELLACEVIDDDGGPVYVPALDQFFESATDAVDYAGDMDEPAAGTIAVPCDRVPARTPDLVEVVEIAWAEQFDEDIFSELEPAARRILADAQTAVAAHAPTLWVMRDGVRINLPHRDP